MTASYPAGRRTFYDGDVRNESAAIVGLARDLARWQNTTYARDLIVTPSDGAVFTGSSADAKGWSYGQVSSIAEPQNWIFDPALRNYAEIFLPDPRGPFRQVRLEVYVTLQASDAVGQVVVTNTRTNVSTTLDVTYAALGSVLSGWLYVDVDAAALDTLHVEAKWVYTGGGNTLYLKGLSGYWLPPTIVGITQQTWGHVDPAALIRDDGPYSTFALRWLARMSNALWYQRPLQVISRWFWGYGSGTSTDWSDYERIVGRYRVWIGPGTSQLDVRMVTRHSTSTVTLTLSGGLGSTTVTPSATTASVQSATISIASPPTSGGVYELTVEVDGDPTYFEVRALSVWESSVSLSLVGGVSVPTDFVPNDDGALSGRPKILTADLQRLEENLRWLWSYRRVRHLVNDSRYTSPFGDPGRGVLEEPSGATATGDGHTAIHWYKTSRMAPGSLSAPALRIRQGTHIPLAAYGGAYAGNSLQTQVGNLSGTEAAWSPKIINPNLSEYSGLSWLGHLQTHWQHRKAAAYTDETVYRIDTYSSGGAISPSGNSTHHAWTILEELPIGTPDLVGAP